jgi:hypothetical protein
VTLGRWITRVKDDGTGSKESEWGPFKDLGQPGLPSALRLHFDEGGEIDTNSILEGLSAHPMWFWIRTQTQTVGIKAALSQWMSVKMEIVEYNKDWSESCAHLTQQGTIGT